MANIYFKCSCGKSLAVDENGAGEKVTCPDCGVPVTVPIPNIHWKCPCGSIMLALDSISGQTVQCYDCKTRSQVPILDKPITTKILIYSKKLP